MIWVRATWVLGCWLYRTHLIAGHCLSSGLTSDWDSKAFISSSRNRVEGVIDTQVPAVDVLWWIVSFSSFLLALAKERCAFVDRLNWRDQPFFTRGWRRSRCGSNQDLSKLFSLKDCHRKIYTYMQRGDDRRWIDLWSWANKYFHNLQYLNDRTFLSLAWLSRISRPTAKSSFCRVSAWLWVWF